MVGLFWRWHLSKNLKERRELVDHNYILRKNNSGQRKQRLWDRSVPGVWKTNNKPYPGPINQIMNFNCILWLLIYTLTFEKPQKKSLLPWCAKSLQLCPTLCNTMGCNPPVSSVHRIFQARILEWLAMPSFRGSSWPRNQTRVSYVSCTGSWILYHWCHLESPSLAW